MAALCILQVMPAHPTAWYLPSLPVQSCDPSVVDIEHIPEGADADAPVIQMVRMQPF
jgi:hypothetical protein